MESKHEVADLVRAYAVRVTTFTKPVKITITAYFKGKRHIDTSNIDDKTYVDALIHAKVIEDDNAYHNPVVIKEVCTDMTEDKLLIRIEEV